MSDFQFRLRLEAERRRRAQAQPDVPEAAQAAPSAQRNPDGTYGQIPEGFVLNPNTGQYTSREMLAANQQPSRAGAFMAGGAQGVTLGGVDELAGGIGALVGQGDYQRELARARLDAARRDFPGTTLTGEIAGAASIPLAANTVRGAMAVGGATGTTYGALSTEGGIAERAQGAGIGGGVGLVAGAAAVPVARAASWAAQRFGRAVGNVFRSDKLFRNGQLTAEGRETLQALGMSADEVSDAFAQHFSRLTREGVDPQAGAQVASMREFGIPAYRHNITGTVDDFASFERARRGAIGPAAESLARRAGDAQDAAMREAGERIATGLGGGVADQADAAAGAISGVRRAQEAARTTAGQAYEALEAAGGGVRGTAVANFGSQLRNSLRMAGSQIDERLTPNAVTALRDLDNIFQNADRGTVSFMQLERARQNLVRLRSMAERGTLGADQNAMGNVLRAFDDQVDRLMDTALTEGSEEALNLARNARGLWANYRNTFMGDGAASRFIQRMADQDASPDDVARWLFSSGKLGSGRFNSTIAKGVRDVLGEGSEEWNAIRQAAFRQMTRKPEGMTQWGPAELANRIQEFLGSGTSRELSRELFAGKERALMQRYAGALRRMQAPVGAVNYSNTAYEASRLVREAFNGIGAMLGAGASGALGIPGPVGAGVGFLAAVGAGAARNAARGVAAVSQRAPVSVSGANAARAAAGATIGATSATNQVLPR